jgi:hypothetical protein
MRLIRIAAKAMQYVRRMVRLPFWAVGLDKFFPAGHGSRDKWEGYWKAYTMSNRNTPEYPVLTGKESFF